MQEALTNISREKVRAGCRLIAVLFLLCFFCMRNQQILDQVAGPKGCRAYEEKRAARLGFPNVYAYFEHKLEEKAFEANFEAAKLEHFRIEKKIGSFKR